MDIETQGEVIPAPDLDIRTTLRQTQLLKLFAYMAENRITSLAEACRDLGLEPRTVKRWMAKEENQPLLAKLQAGEIQAALQYCVSNLPRIIEEQVSIALGARDPKDRTRAAAFVKSFIDGQNKLAGSREEGHIATHVVNFELKGPITFQASPAKRGDED